MRVKILTNKLVRIGSSGEEKIRPGIENDKRE